MKRQITALVEYSGTLSHHIVCFNDIKEYDSFIAKSIWISGYVIDSESLAIGTPISLHIREFECNGLLENKSYYLPEEKIEFIEIECYPNWLDNLLKKMGLNSASFVPKPCA